MIDISPEQLATAALGKAVVVTGATRGIGLAISQVLARDGAVVIGVDVPQARCRCNRRCRDQRYCTSLDVTTDDALNSCDCCTQQDTKVLGMVHNAGITRDKMLSRMSEQQWQLLIDINMAVSKN